jgi:hypothetical protein
MTTGIKLIAIERKEQIKKHKRTVLKDACFNTSKQLSSAAGSLIFENTKDYDFAESIRKLTIPEGWDKEIWHKMASKTYLERLIIAGALIAAEIDRLLYKEKAEAETQS